MVKTKLNNFLFDIESGGLDPTKSSLLSLAYRQNGKTTSLFAKPVQGSFLSKFSEENIIPQLRSADTLHSEEHLIKHFIGELGKDKTASLSGFNISTFDIGFMQVRARKYGLESDFLKATTNRQVVDPIHQVKDVISRNISSHIDSGTFSSQLGNQSFEQATELYKDLHFKDRPTEYNLLAQIQGYTKTDDPTAKFKGWKLEDINTILERHGGLSSIEGKAHEAATDLLMTERVQAAATSGLLEETYRKPAAALDWLELTKARGFSKPSSVGRTITKEFANSFNPTLLSRTSKFLQAHKRTIAFGAGAIIAANIFSGKDDEYNSIEGLPHGNMAQMGRLKLTPFGSGWNSLRNLAKGTETFEDMISSKGFQHALKKAKKTKKLGQGSFGSAYQMEGSFRGQNFSFVRKRGFVTKNEAVIPTLFDKEFAPNIYRSGKDFIDMEHIQGKTLYDTVKAGNISQDHIDKFQGVVERFRQSKMVHGDLHGGNVMVTPEGNIGVLDFGASGPVKQSGYFKHQLTGAEYRVGSMDVRDFKYDQEKLEHFVAYTRQRTGSNDYHLKTVGEPLAVTEDMTSMSTPKQRRGHSDKTPQQRKLNQAEMQRTASGIVHRNGTTGGKRSRM